MLLALAQDDRGRWIAVCVLTAIAMRSFVTAFFPNWNVRWGGRQSRRVIPMSVRGRIAFGIMPAGAAILLSVAPAHPSKLFASIGMGIFALIMIGVGIMHRRDKRAYQKSTELIAGEEN